MNSTDEGPCASFGCQYRPPDDPVEFGAWVGELAAFLAAAYGRGYASTRVRWRLGTEANGPRWSDHGKYFGRYWDSYRHAMAAVKAQLGATARVGASNWLEVFANGAGNLTANGTDSFQFRFYSNVAADPAVPLDFVSVSHYGSGRPPPRLVNFPGSDFSLRSPGTTTGALELAQMRRLARRPRATLEVQEWSILSNELAQPTFEPSGVGTAWAGASLATHVCGGADRVFHWEEGTSLRNASGDGRLVNFFEQAPWNAALLELFLGGAATFRVLDYVDGNGDGGGARGEAPARVALNSTLGIVESGHAANGTYHALVAAVGAERNASWSTTVELRAAAASAPLAFPHGATVQQWRMDASVSVVETLLRELREEPGTLLHADGLPYDLGRMLTPAGFEFAQRPENLERYWRMHAATFKPAPFEGVATPGAGGTLALAFQVASASVTVIRAVALSPPTNS